MDHYYGMIAAFYTHLFVFAWLLWKKWAHLKAYLITGAVVLLGYLPWLVVFIKQTLDVHKGFWLGPVSVEGVVLAFLQPFAYKEIFPTLQPTTIIVLLLSLALIVYGVVWAKRKQTEPELTMSLLLLFVYLGVMVATIIISLFLSPIFYSRYMLVCAGLFLLLLSLGIGLLPGKYWQLAAVIIFALLNVFTLKDIYTQYFNYPMQMVAQDLQAEIQPGDLIITSDSYSMGPALYYFPEAVHYYSNNTIEAQWGHVLKPLTPPLHYEEGLKELLATHQSFWYITCNTGASKNIATILKGEPGWEETFTPRTYSTPYSFVAFTVSKYTHTGRAAAHPQGTLNIHLTNLRPVGYLMIGLFNQGIVNTKPYQTKPYRFETINVDKIELTYSFDGLDYGEYALAIAHDENKNHNHDLDSQGELPVEGVFILNLEKVDAALGKESLTFDNLKFSFNEPEKTIEAKMMYPPFIKPSN